MKLDKYSELTPVKDYELEALYCDMLDEEYLECIIAGYSYSTSKALKEIDPIAFRCGLLDYIDSISPDLIIQANGVWFWTKDVEAVDNQTS